MATGSPKRWIVGVVAICSAILLLTSAAPAQEVTTEPTLDELVAAIAGTLVLTADQQAELVQLLTSAIESELLTTVQAAALLDAVSLDTLTEETADFAAEALEIALASILSGRVEPDSVLVALTDAVAAQDLGLLASTLADLAAPPGILQTIEAAAIAVGMDEASVAALLDLVRSLIVADVPPGIVVRVTRDLLDETLDLAELTTALTSLGALIEGGTAPGIAANQIARVGLELERERNKNQNRGTGGQPEQEQEQNGNGASSGKGG